MSAKRKAIRQAIVARLIGVTAAGANVFSNRAEAIHWVDNQGDLPAVVVYSRSEDGERYEESPISHRHSAMIAVEAFTHRVGVPPIDDDVEDLCEEIQAALLSDPTAAGTAERIRYVSTEIDTDARGEVLLGNVRITLEYQYLSEYAQTVPDPNLDDFDSAQFDIDTDKASPAIQGDKDYT